MNASNPMKGRQASASRGTVCASGGGGTGPQTGGDGRCGAKTRNGGRCQKWPVEGATRCRNHGGATPRSKAAAARRLAMAEWGTTFGEIGPAEDPAVVMARLIQQASGHVAWLLERVQETEGEALIWGLASRTEKGATEFPGVDETYQAQTHGWLKLYSAERDRLVRMCEVAARMGVDERLVTLAEVQTKIMFEAMNRALDDLELTAEQRRRVPDVMAGLLRGMATEGRPELPAA
ncbi:hypothetical protein MUK60_10170 [Streptomyces sp. LRE541]|uniref:HGGxSTG domain-containing protein n=1 Tax=Streptomyces sp. LRE541 TaxID=2931983 RepID=UPI00200EDCE0|nr:HGGxSTG domain-containing protein [Streptomyces sp. LRE541]UPZ28150.1 hypothetical protein MUK60_10170 [Streptomyces sp. LRE541]